MTSTSTSPRLRTLLEDRFVRLVDEVEPLLEQREMERAGEAREAGKTESAEELNQAVRRIRQAAGAEELEGTLLDAAGAYCEGAALFQVAPDVVQGLRIRGVSDEVAARFPALEIPLDDAAAMAGAISTRDPVVAMSTAGEVSQAMLEITGQDESARAAVFPVCGPEEVAALLYCWGKMQSAPIELLTQVAGLCLPPPQEEPEPEPEPELVAIAPAPVGEAPPAAAPGTGQAAGWRDLPEAEQRLHLRAQRFARVQVSEWRLQQAESVHAGRLHRDLYGVLQESIDRARERFRREFIAACPGMVDYLHLELVRTLAHDNPGLLGADYPGPLV